MNERTELVKILADLTRQQEKLNSKVLAKVIHYLRLWINRLYRQATKYVDNDLIPPSEGI